MSKPENNILSAPQKECGDLLSNCTPFATCFLLKQDNKEPIPIPIDGSGDNTVSNMFREAMHEYLSFRSGEFELKKKCDWMEHWRRLRFKKSLTRMSFSKSDKKSLLDKLLESSKLPNLTNLLFDLKHSKNNFRGSNEVGVCTSPISTFSSSESNIDLQLPFEPFSQESVIVGETCQSVFSSKISPVEKKLDSSCIEGRPDVDVHLPSLDDEYQGTYSSEEDHVNEFFTGHDTVTKSLSDTFSIQTPNCLANGSIKSTSSETPLLNEIRSSYSTTAKSHVNEPSLGKGCGSASGPIIIPLVGNFNDKHNCSREMPQKFQITVPCTSTQLGLQRQVACSQKNFEGLGFKPEQTPQNNFEQRKNHCMPKSAVKDSCEPNISNLEKLGFANGPHNSMENEPPTKLMKLAQNDITRQYSQKPTHHDHSMSCYNRNNVGTTYNSLFDQHDAFNHYSSHDNHHKIVGSHDHTGDHNFLDHDRHHTDNWFHEEGLADEELDWLVEYFLDEPMNEC